MDVSITLVTDRDDYLTTGIRINRRVVGNRYNRTLTIRVIAVRLSVNE